MRNGINKVLNALNTKIKDSRDDINKLASVLDLCSAILEDETTREELVNSLEKVAVSIHIEGYKMYTLIKVRHSTECHAVKESFHGEDTISCTSYTVDIEEAIAA